MMKILKKYILILCINQYFCGPIENRRQFNHLNNFQEVKLHFPVQEIPILYPVQSQNYEKFNNPFKNYDFTGFEPQSTGVRDREELITPKPQSDQNGRLINRDPVRNQAPVKNRQKETPQNLNQFNEGSFEERSPTLEHYRTENNPQNYHFEDTKIKENYEPSSQKQNSDTKNVDSSDFDSSHEDLLDHGYDDNFEENSKKEKDHLDQKYQDDYAEDGEEEDSGFDKEQYKKDSGNFEKEGRDEKFLEKEGHKKGHKTKGYNNKFHRDEIHREHKFYDDDKPNYKDQKVAKSEVVSKKKLSKDLDTYKEIFEPKYSIPNYAGNFDYPQNNRRHPREQNQASNQNYLKQNYKKQPIPRKTTSIPSKNVSVHRKNHDLRPKKHSLDHKKHPLPPKNHSLQNKKLSLPSKNHSLHHKNQPLPPKSYALHHKNHSLLPENHFLNHRNNLLSTGHNFAPISPVSFHARNPPPKNHLVISKNVSLPSRHDSFINYSQLPSKGPGRFVIQNLKKYKRANNKTKLESTNTVSDKDQHILVPVGASILVADNSGKNGNENNSPEIQRRTNHRVLY